MSALEERQQTAREAGLDEIGPDRVLRSDAARAIEAAIETATRVRVTHEVVMAFIEAASKAENIAGPLRAAFEAAGFEVTE